MPLPQEHRDRLRELLDEVAPLLDEMVELCSEDPYLRAYVPGNLWASRYGYLGKAALDYVEEYLEKGGVFDE
jgi:hypothetical protein